VTGVAFNTENAQNGWVRITGHVRNGGTAGNVQIRFASNTSDQQSTVYADSVLIGRRTN
jgi:hypothetical protein